MQKFVNNYNDNNLVWWHCDAPVVIMPYQMNAFLRVLQKKRKTSIKSTRKTFELLGPATAKDPSQSDDYVQQFHYERQKLKVIDQAPKSTNAMVS